MRIAKSRREGTGAIELWCPPASINLSNINSDIFEEILYFLSMEEILLNVRTLSLDFYQAVTLSFPNILNLNGCDYLLRSTPPTQNVLHNFSIKSNTAYVRTDTNLFYVDKIDKTIDLLPVDEEKLKKLDKEINPDCKKVKTLSEDELEVIASITHHVRRQNSDLFAELKRKATLNIVKQASNKVWLVHGPLGRDPKFIDYFIRQSAMATFSQYFQLLLFRNPVYRSLYRNVPRAAFEVSYSVEDELDVATISFRPIRKLMLAIKNPSAEEKTRCAIDLADLQMHGDRASPYKLTVETAQALQHRTVDPAHQLAQIDRVSRAKIEYPSRARRLLALSMIPSLFLMILMWVGARKNDETMLAVSMSLSLPLEILRLYLFMTRLCFPKLSSPPECFVKSRRDNSYKEVEKINQGVAKEVCANLRAVDNFFKQLAEPRLHGKEHVVNINDDVSIEESKSSDPLLPRRSMS